MKRWTVLFLAITVLIVFNGRGFGDETVYRSKVLTGGGEPEFFDVALPHARFLHLIVEDAGDGNSDDHADWAEAQLKTQDGRIIPLGELTPIYREQGWGNLQKDRSCDGYPLTIGRREFSTGLGTHAYAHIVYPWDGSAVRLSAFIGVDATQTNRGSVVFVVNTSQEFANPATIPTPRGESWWIEQSHSFDRLAQETPRINLVFLGDSITERWGTDGRNVWARTYASRDAVNFGIGGDRTENTLWRIFNGNFEGTIAAANPKVIVLMIGTNNYGSLAAEYIAKGVAANVAALRAKVPHSRILLLGIFPRGQSPNDPGRQEVSRVNQIIAGLHDNQSIFFKDISAALIEQDGTISPKIMPDYLHLSEEGYTRWAAAIESNLASLLAM